MYSWHYVCNMLDSAASTTASGAPPVCFSSASHRVSSGAPAAFIEGHI